MRPFDLVEMIETQRAEYLAHPNVRQMREALESVQAVSDTWSPQLADARVKVDDALRGLKEGKE